MEQKLEARTFAAGRHVVDLESVPAGAYKQVGVRFSRAGWPLTESANLIRGAFEVSVDGGKAWQPVGEFTVPGGTLQRRGEVVGHSYVAFPFVNPRSGARAAKAGAFRLVLQVAMELTTTITLLGDE